MEVREARLAGLPERLAIHEGDHQHFARFRVLDDGRKQTRRVEFRIEAAPLLPLRAFSFVAGDGRFLSDSCEEAGPRASLLHDNHRCGPKSIGAREGAFFDNLSVK